MNVFFKLDINTAIVVVFVVAFTAGAVPSSAWNARYFQQNERDVYDPTRLRLTSDNRDWTNYYFPFYLGPSYFRPRSFMSPTTKDCLAMCTLAPAPFENSEDCQDACDRPNQTLCQKRSVHKCLREKGLFSEVVPVFKAHNWLTNVAVWMLKGYGLWWREISDEDLKYIHYGLNFADHPWTGRPDAIDAGKDKVIGLWDMEERALKNAVFDRDTSPTSRYLVESRFLGGGNNPEKDGFPNLYLSTRHKAEMFEKNKVTAADNLFHFPNRDAAAGGSRSILLRSFGAIDKDPVFEKCDVSVMQYGVVLFQLARQFWPGNPGSEPNLFELPRVYSHKGPGRPETGAIVMDHLLGPLDHVERAYLPSTYLGGNPFICAPPTEEASRKRPPKAYRNDLCRFGQPTWPIWVPEDSRFDPSATADCFDHTCPKNLELGCLRHPKCVKDYHTALKAQFPGKSQRSALIYLGWALHMIQDVSMPRHAANWLGTAHENIESEADRMIRLGYGMQSKEDGGFADWAPFYEKAEKIFGQGRTRKQICGDLGLDESDRFDDPNLKKLFDGVRDDAYGDRKKIKGRSNEKGTRREEYIQIAFQRSILASMKLLVCLEILDI